MTRVGLLWLEAMKRGRVPGLCEALDGNQWLYCRVTNFNIKYMQNIWKDTTTSKKELQIQFICMVLWRIKLFKQNNVTTSSIFFPIHCSVYTVTVNTMHSEFQTASLNKPQINEWINKFKFLRYLQNQVSKGLSWLQSRSARNGEEKNAPIWRKINTDKLVIS
jgi:hypothetical protein